MTREIFRHDPIALQQRTCSRGSRHAQKTSNTFQEVELNQGKVDSFHRERAFRPMFSDVPHRLPRILPWSED
jgi:hypothetical protein